MTTFAALKSEFKPGDIYLTRSQESARTLRAHLSQSITQDPYVAVLSPCMILSISEFVDQLWDDYLYDHTLLDRIQLLAFSKEFLAQESSDMESIMFKTNLARKLVHALEILSDYQITIDHEECFLSPEYRLLESFKQWLDRKLQSMNAVCWFDKVSLLINSIATINTRYSRIYIDQNINLRPKEIALIAQLRSVGIEVIRCNEHHESKKALTGYTFPTETDECRAVAKWVGRLLGNESAHSPSIAIAVPDLNVSNHRLTSALDKHAFPYVLESDQAGVFSRLPYRIASGVTLGSLPAIKTLLHLLTLASHSEMDLEAVSNVLLSPNIGEWEATAESRYQLDIVCREKLTRVVSRGSILGIWDRQMTDDNRSFILQINTVIDSFNQCSRLETASQWASLVRSVIEISGWRSNVEARQGKWVVEAFEHAVNHLARLDLIKSRMNFLTALTWLREIVATTRTGCKANVVQPVTIISWDDIHDYTFDYVWVMGVNTNTLPRKPSNNPFIPQHIQDKAAVFLCNTSQCADVAERFLRELSAFSGDVSISTSITNEKGSTVCTHPGITQWVPHDDVNEQRSEKIVLEHLRDTLPVMGDQEKDSVLGGVSLLKDCEQSPLLSAIRHRMRVKPFPSITTGLNSQLQGILVHEVLESIWKELKTSVNLNALDKDALLLVAQKHVNVVAEKSSAVGLSRFGETVVDLERRRVTTLLVQWLSYEQARKYPFEVVEIEKRKCMCINGLSITVKIDRIDKLLIDDESRCVVIDYKTSRHIDMSSMNASMMKEPQLPLYTCGAGESIDGVAIAKVSIDHCAVHLRSNFTNTLHQKRANKSDVDSSESWRAQLASWKNTLGMLVDSLINGECTLPEKLPQHLEDLYAFYNSDWAYCVTTKVGDNE